MQTPSPSTFSNDSKKEYQDTECQRGRKDHESQDAQVWTGGFQGKVQQQKEKDHDNADQDD